MDFLGFLKDFGVIVFFVWQKSKNEWPFNKAAAPTKTVAVEMDKPVAAPATEEAAEGTTERA